MISSTFQFSKTFARQQTNATKYLNLSSITKTLLSTQFRQTSSTAHHDTFKIGFVGLGNMGLHMCRNLIANRTPDRGTLHSSTESIIAYDINPSSLSKAVEGGATAASDLLDIADCSLIITSLPDCNSVEKVFGALMEAIPTNPPRTMTAHSRVFVDTSTVSPLLTRSLFDTAVGNGHILVDAPVSGGVRGAEDGTLTFMVGCDANTDTLDRISPYLKRMGKSIIDCGGPGTGSATKLCNNLALSAQMVGICEAMNLGEELGVDPIVLADVMNSSTARCWSCEVNNPHPSVATARGRGKMPASREYQGGFGTKLMLKDLGLALSAADEVGVAIPLGATSKQLYQLADINGMGEKDFGVLLQYLKGRKV